MNRLLFYSEFDNDGTKELDYLYNSLSNFEQNYESTYYRVKESDVYRPYLISYNLYGTVNYWWLICFVNNINDVFYELQVGMLLEIPNILDINDFYQKYKVR